MITIGIWYYADPDGLERTVTSLHAHTAGTCRVVVLGDGRHATTGAADGLPHLDTDCPLGAAACFNRLAAHDDAEVIVFLESGCRVTAGWLDRLLSALQADPRHGLAGPSTNRAWNPQRLHDAPRENAPDHEVETYAAQVTRRSAGMYRSLEPLYSLADFCYAVTRRVLDTVGDADTQYGRGPCWEMDYNVRAARAGFHGIWVCGAYVHRPPALAHRLRDEARLIDTNRRRYQDKFCQWRLQRQRTTYCGHCEGEACAAFAPRALIQLGQPAPPPHRPAPDQERHGLTLGQAPDRSHRVEPHTPPVTTYGPGGGAEHMPMVSCIMPTHNRRSFVGQAIGYFLRQDYPNRELIIVDDGSEPVQDLLPDDPRLRYLRLTRERTVGAKRNMACQEARGEVIAHWDDDDWMAPWRLRYQVDSLRAAQADMCGLDQVLFFDPRGGRAWRYCYPRGAKPWVAGGTLCYTKAFWRQHPFRDLNVGEDSHFVWSSAAARLLTLRDQTFYAALVHAGNTSPKRTTDPRWTSYPIAEVRALLAADWAFYRRHSYQHPRAAFDTRGTIPVSVGAADRRPLVSCVMPTANRRRFVPRAIEYFLRQDYPHRELIIVDDGAEPIDDLVPDHTAIRYIHLAKKHSIGTKRNLACQASRGTLIVCWDDDDWYAPHRISYQVAPLLEGRADVSGLDRGLLLSLPARQFWASTAQLHRRMFAEGVVGGTMAFWKRLWEQGVRFPDASLAEDAAFLQSLIRRGARLERLANDDTFIYVRHGQNSWQFTPGHFLDGRGWRRVEPPSFLSASDCAFYGLMPTPLAGAI
jgi:glycosyltransferase involved in cell wall biosynthesis